MLTALVWMLLAVVGAAALVWPWIGVVSAYVVAVLTPQEIWHWAFGDIRPFFYVMLPTLAGLGLASVLRRVDPVSLKVSGFWWIVAFWFFQTSSFLFGSYVDVWNESRFFNPASVNTSLQTTFVTFLAAVLLLTTVRRLMFASGVMVVTTIYMTYWTNMQYLTGAQFGRTSGPASPDGVSIYLDENIFAALLVMGFPFLLVGGSRAKSVVLRWTLWLAVPFCWHAIFLTGSRGALLATALVLVCAAIRSTRKGLAVAGIIAFSVAFFWQAGDTMKSRAFGMEDFREDASATGRLESWTAGARMLLAHPITGVGLASYGQAFPYFSDAKPLIAHNTVVQVAAESGVFAVVSYGAGLIMIFVALLRRARRLSGAEDADRTARQLAYLVESCQLSLVGFAGCQLFLSLQAFEPLYLLLAIAIGAIAMTDRWLLQRENNVTEKWRAGSKHLPKAFSGRRPA
jgi:O-antigen ligase